MHKCNGVFANFVIRILLVGALGSIALAALPAKGYADVDKKFDWKNKNRNLKICLEPAGCPAGMADSVKAAIALWKKKLVSWKIEWSDSCNGADVKIKCGDIKGLGLWNNTSGSYDNLTKITVGSHCISADPLFVNPGSGDFHLGGGSPCIGTASDNGDMGYRY